VDKIVKSGGAALIFLVGATAWARPPISPHRLILVQQASARGWEGLSLTPAPEQTTVNEASGTPLFKILERKMTLPVVGTVLIRRGRLPAPADLPQKDKIVQSGRIWEKISNGFERWTLVYHTSIQFVKMLD
jgi:hypothetical protein